MRRIFALMLTVALVLSAVAGAGVRPVSAVAATPLNWTKVDPLADQADLTAATVIDGMTVAVGAGGTILCDLSVTGWIPVKSGTENELTAIASGGGLLVAVGDLGTIVTSPDGLTWTLREAPTQYRLTGVAYGNGTWVVTSGGGLVLTSPDGVTWSRQETGVEGWLLSVAYGAGRFVAVGALGRIITSVDGVTWAPGDSGTERDLMAVTYGGGQFVAVGTMGTVLTSPDGTAWSLQPSVPPGHLLTVTYDGERFVAAGEQGEVLTSPDGRTWSAGTAGTDRHLTGAAAKGPGQTVIVGKNGAILQPKPYEPLPTWAPEPRLLLSLAFGNGRFVTTADRSDVFVSTDGVHWERHPLKYQGGMPYRITQVAFGNGQFVAIADNQRYPTLLTSPDGVTWTINARGETGFIGRLLGITAGGGRFFLTYQMAPGGTFPGRTTVDGVNWEATGPGGIFPSYGYGKGRFMAVSGDNQGQSHYFVSSDGMHWTENRLASLPVYGQGLFLTVSPEHTLLASTDAVAWSGAQNAPAGTVKAVGYIPGQFQLVMADGARYVSEDGVGWAPDPGGMTWTTPLKAYGNGKVVLVTGTSLASATICGERFADVPGTHPGCPAVEELAGRGVAAGYPDGSYRPDGPVTRAEFAKLLVLTLGRVPQSEGDLPFSDAAGHWAAAGGYLQAVRALGAISGYPDGTFRPDAPVTRAELVKIAAAATGLKPAPAETDAWYDGWVAAARKAALIGSGATHVLWADSGFAANQPATRAEAAMVLANLLEIVR